MERIRKDEEEKRKKEQEKAERAERRKRKQEEKQRKASQKKASPCQREKRAQHDLDDDIPEWYCTQCLLPHSTEGLWVECDGCQWWYHASCAGYGGWNERELQSETFVCRICTTEMKRMTRS